MKSRMQPQDRPRAWQRMLSGRRLDLLNPTPFDIEITDIAHGLARVARWNGQTIGEHALSVAQHSLIVEEIFTALEPEASRQSRMMALLHDAPEYVIGDLISPFKAAVGLNYKAVETRLLSAIYIRFGLPGEPPEHICKAIKKADAIAAFYEATALAGFSAKEAIELFGAPTLIPESLALRLAKLEATPTTVAHRDFVRKFNELTEP